MNTAEQTAVLQAVDVLRHAPHAPEFHAKRLTWASQFELVALAAGDAEIEAKALQYARLILDAEIERSSHAARATPSHVQEMQARLDMLEAALDEPIGMERAREVMAEMIDLQAAIEKENGAIDDYAFGRMLLKAGPL